MNVDPPFSCENGTTIKNFNASKSGCFDAHPIGTDWDNFYGETGQFPLLICQMLWYFY